MIASKVTFRLQDIIWMYIKRSEDHVAQDLFWTSYVRSIYVLCLEEESNLH